MAALYVNVFTMSLRFLSLRRRTIVVKPLGAVFLFAYRLYGRSADQKYRPPSPFRPRSYPRFCTHRKYLAIYFIHDLPVKLYGVVKFYGYSHTMVVDVIDNNVVVTTKNPYYVVPFRLIKIYPVVLHKI